MSTIKNDIQTILEDLQKFNLTTEVTNVIDKVKSLITKVEVENPTETKDIEKVIEDAPITPVIEADVTKVEKAVEAPITPPLTPETGFAGSTGTTVPEVVNIGTELPGTSN